MRQDILQKPTRAPSFPASNFKSTKAWFAAHGSQMFSPGAHMATDPIGCEFQAMFLRRKTYALHAGFGGCILPHERTEVVKGGTSGGSMGDTTDGEKASKALEKHLIILSLFHRLVLQHQVNHFIETSSDLH